MPDLSIKLEFVTDRDFQAELGNPSTEYHGKRRILFKNEQVAGNLKKQLENYFRILTLDLLTVPSPFNSQDLISNFPYCLPNDSHYVSLENLVWNQFVIIQYILVTCLHDTVWI